MIGLKVQKNDADKIRRVLLNLSLLNIDAKIKRINDFVFIPLISTPNYSLMDKLKSYEVEIVDTNFEVHTKGPKSLNSILNGKIDDDKVEEI